MRTILEEYRTGGTWTTYGSFEGRYSNEVKAITSKAFNNLRHTAWLFGHPRSFKVGLTKYTLDADFKEASTDRFFVKASERGFMYRWYELAGFERIKYISDKLVHYRWRSGNTERYKTSAYILESKKPDFRG